MHFFQKHFVSISPFFLLIVLGIGLFAAVSLSNKQQNLESNAQSDITCITVNDTTQTATDATSATKDLIKKSKDLRTISLSNKTTSLDVKNAAQTRKIALIRLMRRDPKKAKANVLSNIDRTEVDSVTNNCVEKEAQVEGSIESIHVDFEDGRNPDVLTLTTPQNEKYSLYPVGTQKIPLTSGMRVKITGLRLDNNILFDADNTNNVDIVSSPPPVSDAAAQGVQNTIVLMANFSDTPQPSISQTTISTAVFTDMNNYYKETSYNKTSIAGNVRNGWLQLGITRRCSVTNNDLATVASTAVNVAGSSVDFTQYSRLIIFAPFGTAQQCGFAGAGIIGQTATIAGKKYSISWINLTVYNGTANWLTRVVSHEYGHNLGVNHAAMPACNCQLPEYGDPYSVMGKNQYGGSDQVVQMNAPHKEKIGWLTSANIQTVATSGTFTLLPLESSSSGLKAIKIPRSGSDYLYVEYRQPIGVDANISNIPGENALGGALIHSLDPSDTRRTFLIDTTPLTSVPDSAIDVGSSYRDSQSGATISVANGSTQASSALTVQVSFGTSPPTGGPTNTLTPTPSGPSVTPGGPTDTPTPSPTPGGPDTPTPTLPAGETVNVSYVVGLHGIGSAGDGQNPTSSGNQNPLTRQHELFIALFDDQDNFISYEVGNMTYNSSTGKFTGTATLPKDDQTNYIVRLWSEGYLSERLYGMYLFGSDVILPSVNLTTGDINADDSLDILDYNELILCYSGILPATNCSNSQQLHASDLNDDGLVNQTDYNLFLRELRATQG